MTSWLISYFETNHLLNERQYGFREYKSTKLALINFVKERIYTVLKLG